MYFCNSICLFPSTYSTAELASCRNPFAAAVVTSHKQSRNTKDASDKSNCRVTRKPKAAWPSQTPSNGNLNKSTQLNCQLSSFKSNRKWIVLWWGSLEATPSCQACKMRASKQTRSILSGETWRSSDPMLHAGIFCGWKRCPEATQSSLLNCFHSDRKENSMSLHSS